MRVLVLVIVALLATGAVAQTRPTAAAADLSFAQGAARLAPSLVSWSRARALKPLGSIPALRAEIEQRAARERGLLGQMSVDDAVIYMMFLISRDSHDDVRDLLAEMEALNAKRAAMRRAQQEMREANARAKAAARDAYDQRTDDDEDED